MVILKDGQQLTGYCIADPRCDRVANTFTIQVSSFSVFELVSPENDPPSAEAGGPYVVSEGSSLTLDATGSSDPDEDIILYEWDLDNDGAYDDATGSTVERSFTDDDYLIVSVKVTDELDEFSEDSAEVTVANVSPAVELSDNVIIDEGGTMIGSGSFSDPGADSWTATIDYGDGSGAEGVALDPDNAFNLSHVYNDSGEFEVIVIVTDDDGGDGIGILPITVLSPRDIVLVVKNQLQAKVDADPKSDSADILQDAIDNLKDVLNELDKSPPENQLAFGSLEGAVGDLETAVDDGALDASEGVAFMDRLAGAARELAVNAIEQSTASTRDINRANRDIDRGDNLRAEGKYRKAIGKYWDALSNAEG
jgi:hypothetical protein